MDAACGSDWRSDQVSLNTNGCTQSRTPAHLDQQTSSQKQTFGCAHCISTFKTRGNLRLHLNGVHLVEPLKKLQYSKCDFCDSYYKLKKRLEKHMALNHKENFVILNPHKCGCGESFPSMFACIKHQRISNCAPKKKSTHKIDAKYGNLPPNLTTSKSTKKKLNTIPKCVQCDKTFTSTFNLKRHMETHKHPPHECSICSKSFHQKTTLQTHLKTVHLGIRSFQCSHCLARFTQKVYLKNHIKSIHPTDPVIQAQAHKCQFCDSYYSCKIHLSKHMTNLHMNVAEGDLNSITQQDIVKNNNHLDSKLESRLEDIQLESCESKKTPNDDFSAPSSVRDYLDSR